MIRSVMAKEPDYEQPNPNRSEAWAARLRELSGRIKPAKLQVAGKLTRMAGLTLEAVGCQAPIGARCLVSTLFGTQVEAEVVGFDDEKIYLMPIGDIRGLAPQAKVIVTDLVFDVRVGDALLGRVLSGTGEPIDGKGAISGFRQVSILGRQINPLKRAPIREALDVGIRAINALISVGRGQRMGLFAGSGVGKSVLLGMMTRFTDADVIVVGLIGERGREVKEFIDNILGPHGMARAVVVAAPADDSPVLRLHGAATATCIAEYFRDQGLNVLLLMDSLTRYAQAQREIALAIGEPPATKGYPPSVFAKLPQLVERAGNADVGGGSITAFYTVLTEGDDTNDPIADAARAILDGHIVLSRQLADAGHYPAIDVEASISRAMTEITPQDQQQMVRRFRQLYSTYQRNRDLINVGAYQVGSDPQLDEAIHIMPRLNQFLQQSVKESVDLSASKESLKNLLVKQPDNERKAAPSRTANTLVPAGNSNIFNAR